MSNTLQHSWHVSLSPEELTNYTKLFDSTSTDGRTVTGEQAAALFAHSKLLAPALGQIWDLADQQNTGVLDKQGFFIALKLIACAQHGIRPSLEALSSETPLPSLQPDTHEMAQDTDVISPSDRIKYVRIFKALEPVNGFIKDEKARVVFMRSKLPGGTLGHIWNLVHKNQSDLMSQTEFVVAMHYIARCMAGLKHLPDEIPLSVMTSANNKPPPPPKRKERHSIIQPKKEAPPRSIPKPPVPLMKMNEPWNVDPIEKEQYKVAFDKLNTGNREHIDGSEAVGYFKSSHLSESDLGLIWDLADTQNRGCLSLKEFVIAMHLIRVRKEGYAIPLKLSDSLLASVEDLDRVPSSKGVEIPVADQTTKSFDIRDVGRDIQLENENAELSYLQNSLDQTRSRTVNLLQKEEDITEDLKRISNEKIKLREELETAENEERMIQERITALEKECEAMKTELDSISKASEEQDIKNREKQSELLTVKDKHDSLKAQLAEVHAQDSSSSTTQVLSPPTQKATPPPPPPPKSRMQRNPSVLGDSLKKTQSVRRRAPAPAPVKRQPSTIKSPQTEEASSSSKDTLLGSTLAPVAAAAATATAAIASAMAFTGDEDKEGESSRNIDKAEPEVDSRSTEPVQEPQVEPVQEPQVEPVQEPQVESVQEPQVESVQEPQVESVQEPQVDGVQAQGDGVQEPQIEVVQEPHVETVQEPQIEVVQEPHVETVQEPQIEVVHEPQVEAIQEPLVDTPSNLDTPVDYRTPNNATTQSDNLGYTPADDISLQIDERVNENIIDNRNNAVDDTPIPEPTSGIESGIQEDGVPKEVPVEVFPVVDNANENGGIAAEVAPSNAPAQNNTPVNEPIVEEHDISTVPLSTERSYETDDQYIATQDTANVPQSIIDEQISKELNSQQTSASEDRLHANEHVVAESFDDSSDDNSESEELDDDNKPLSYIHGANEESQASTYNPKDIEHNNVPQVQDNISLATPLDEIPPVQVEYASSDSPLQNEQAKQPSFAERSPFEQEDETQETGTGPVASENEYSDEEAEDKSREYNPFIQDQYDNDTSGIDVLASHPEDFERTNSESSKATDHDFEVVDNASVASSFVSANMGDFTSNHGSLDEFDLTSFEPNDPKVKSTNTTPDKELSAFEAEFEDMLESDDGSEKTTGPPQTTHAYKDAFDAPQGLENREQTATLNQKESGFSGSFVGPSYTADTATSTATPTGHTSVLKGFEGFPFIFGDTETSKTPSHPQSNETPVQSPVAQPEEQPPSTKTLVASHDSPPVEQTAYSTKTLLEPQYEVQPEQTQPSDISENIREFAPSVHNSINNVNEAINPPPVQNLGPKESESVGLLMSMGFTVDQAKDALRRYDNDLQKATNFLLDQY
ncbi:hypothetical protein CLU79DRAFT_719140 [Phycomyces nitens]|nr:hypothetical protein CLU79DRAFT_719140 [Phycomyces nitens]